VIEAGDAGVVHRGQDALGVAALVAGPASVDEQRLAGRSHQQRGLAAFDVDGVKEQGAYLGRGLRRGRGGDEQCQGAEGQERGEEAAAESDGEGSGSDSHLGESVLARLGPGEWKCGPELRVRRRDTGRLARNFSRRVAGRRSGTNRSTACFSRC